mmetsp:Transcript_2561/g.3918  ORF Transcript_2561/g.3918 Transcript_2561/m.3918 type:complete len:87 (-) Transcript_2561:215-475(-)|eukprot:CAMPEP_0195520506 /NCGR_PEP_ID=MMETSP0794_2-20130614/17070_1 /TAXON_ID=515487 /ORGANISM="Stephanopyxis turris, Strain CCMP 815" /LENGTH=86 /DNA_ID=CAMNT_0040649883 /DNA_START=42 /DNA_END=302 /DNA_ORIENTATION=+
MTSYGLKGEASRCFPFWQAFSQCVADAPDARDCLEAREDYLECLHHTKHFARLNAISAEYKRKKDAGTLPESLHNVSEPPSFLRPK